MCLNNNCDDVADFLKKNRRRKIVKVYKLLNRNIRASNPFLYSPYYGKEYIVGENRSNSKRKKPSLKDEKIERGIHVFLDRDAAYFKLHYMDGYIIVEFTAKVKDVIGVKNSHAVFRRVYLSKKELSKHV